jgi:hypothetical protein
MAVLTVFISDFTSLSYSVPVSASVSADEESFISEEPEDLLALQRGKVCVRLCVCVCVRVCVCACASV